jgi:hypothetical protein
MAGGRTTQTGTPGRTTTSVEESRSAAGGGGLTGQVADGAWPTP